MIRDPKFIATLYSFSESRGHAPSWIVEGESFSEFIGTNGNSTTLIVTQNDPMSLDFAAPWLPLDGLDVESLSKIYTHYMIQNSRPDNLAVYGLDQFREELWIRYTVLISSDMEDNIDHYLLVRDSISHHLNSTDEVAAILSAGNN